VLKRILTAIAIVALPLAGGNAQPAVSPGPAPDWTVPDADALPDDALGRTVRRGRDLIVKTSSLIGPDAADPAMRYSGNGLDCQSCHLQAGTQRFGLPLAGVWGVFPTYIARENEIRTLEERINGCMERSMNGRALPVGGAEMKAMLTYIQFVSASEKVGKPLEGRGAPPLPLPEKAADLTHGHQVFTAICAVCHGADGQGQRLEPAEAKDSGRRYRFPPLWGPDSYNDGAGMARGITAAQFVHANMPFGTTSEAPALSIPDTFDVVAFISGQPRPHKPGLEADFPDRARKPVDATYPPFIGPFLPDQHRLGPWPPIQAWMKANGAAARSGD
jgi:thiosulfate dehydrogenase